MDVSHKVTTVALIIFAIGLSGCGSIAQGVTEALLKQDEDEQDTRACEIKAPAFTGVESYLRKQEAERASGGKTPPRAVKILMVHGIGKHLPGYSTRFSDNLMRALGLDVIAERSKEISVQTPPLLAQELGRQTLGNLRVQRFMNKARTRELLFYELTWSEIIEPEKKMIAFDDSGEYTFKRASINRAIKEFVNSHVPDPMIYLGNSRKKILGSVGQSICWMMSGGWEDLPWASDAVCDAAKGDHYLHAETDEFIFVTHSLGSRIMVDTLQLLAQRFQSYKRQFSGAARVRFERLADALQKKRFTVFMLANQLPLLQLGRDMPEVSGKIADYCRPGGPRYDDRLLGELGIVAFSDPNDILSYAIPPKFAEENLDSRLCPRIVNVSINVANVVDLFGLGEFASPAEAHGGYDNDERVIAIIANGVGNPQTADIVRTRCKWLETVRE